MQFSELFHLSVLVLLFNQERKASYDVAHIMHIFQSCSTEVHLENGKNMYTLGCTPNHVSLLEPSFTLRPCNR